jgi:hypothetical protein
MDCVKPEDLLDLLYDEPEGAGAPRVREHLAACAACREELAGLRAVRQALAGWRLAEPPPRVVAVRPRSTWAWAGLAAALVVALAAGFGLAGSELRFEDGRVAFRLGRGPGTDVEAQLAAQEQRHRAEIAALRAEVSGRTLAPELLARVEQMLRASEQRHALLLGASLAEASERYEAQRRYDLARVSASLSYLDGRAGEQLARTSELMGVMLRASDQR